MLFWDMFGVFTTTKKKHAAQQICFMPKQKDTNLWKLWTNDQQNHCCFFFISQAYTFSFLEGLPVVLFLDTVPLTQFLHDIV